MLRRYYPYFFYWGSALVLRVLAVFRLNRGGESYRHRPPKIVIEAGERGWGSIELKELYQSAKEYFGAEAVVQLIVDREKDYLVQVERLLNNNPGITHYLYDPRTGRAEAEQNLANAFFDSLGVALRLSRFRVIPVAFVTDISYRLWRCQAAAVTARAGVVVSFMSNKFSRSMFPHQRLLGPSLFPMSKQRLEQLGALRASLEDAGRVDRKVRFIGSLYEPRTSFFKEFERLMGDRADIRGRGLGSVRKSDDEYWESIASSAIVITTAEQFDQPAADLSSVSHLVYRYLEVMAAGSLLLAPAVPGVETYFTPGVHFVAYESVSDAYEKAAYYLASSDDAEKVRRRGHLRARALIDSRSFWVQINSSLGPDGFF